MFNKYKRRVDIIKKLKDDFWRVYDYLLFELGPNKARMGYLFGLVGGSLFCYFLFQGEFLTGLILVVVIAALLELYSKKFGADFYFRVITDKEYNTAEEFAEIMGTALKEAIKKIENEK